MNSDKLIVLFPGGNYSVDMPLFYYAKFSFELRGYEVLCISYGTNNSTEQSFEEYLVGIKQDVSIQTLNFDFSRYKDIIFVSKSIGTVCAGWLAQERSLNVRHIFLTPIPDSLQYLTGGNIITVIAGTEDRQLKSESLREHCISRNIPLKQFDNVGHRLETTENMDLNLDILKQIVVLYNLA